MLKKLNRNIKHLIYGKARNIYVDLGANEGLTIQKWVEKYPNWYIYGFEPAPVLMNKLKSQFAAYDRITLLEKAVSTKDGKAKFYPGIQSNESSTLMTGKQSQWQVDYNNGYEVDTIDFAKWLQDNTKPNDNVIIKMDIEGAEYDIIERLFQYPKLLKRIREFRVEWHWDRYPQISKEKHEQIRAKLQSMTNMIDWH